MAGVPDSTGPSAGAAGGNAARTDPRHRLRIRIRAGLTHLAASATLAALLVATVSHVWYPGALFELARGREIFLLLLGIDIVLGPLLTLIVFDARKPRGELARDVALIACVQLAAMGYGVDTLLQARPAYIVYNAGQFNVPLATELVHGVGKEAAASERAAPAAPWWGPKLVAARLPDAGGERNDILFSAAAGGADVFQMPSHFVDYATMKEEVARRARTPEALAAELRVDARRVREAALRVAPAGRPIGVLPFVVRHTTAIAVVGLPAGDWIGFAPLSD